MNIQVAYGGTNTTFTAPNKFTFRLNQTLIPSSQAQVSMKSLRMYYSWFNLTAAKKNNSFSYIWHDATTHVVTLQDGIFDYATFQDYLEQQMEANGHYLINASGAKQYFISLVANSALYRISLTVRPIPSTLPVGWTSPVGWVAPAADVTPQLVIPATAIRDYLGFTAGTYPAATQSSLYQVNGPTAPLVTDVTSLQLLTNLVDNEFSSDPRCLSIFSLPPNTQSGQPFSEVPFYQDWIPMKRGGRFSSITLEIVDQNSRPVIIEDPSAFVCSLNILP